MKFLKGWIFALILTASIVSGFYLGVFAGDKIVNKKPQEKVDEPQDISMEEQNNVEIAREEEKIRPNTDIEYIIYYTQCDHTIRESKKPDENMINMNEKDLDEYILSRELDWKVVYFNNNKVIIKVNKEQICPNHYVLKEKDGRIAVYKINEQGEMDLKEIISHPVSLLREVDQEKLRKGIIVDSQEELINTLENFIS